MAKILNPLQSQAVSGKVIAVIHQAWRGLNIVRKFTFPTIKYTASQMARRGNFGTLSTNWKAVLTEIQRDSWRDMNYVIKDLWGNVIRATGLNLYKLINSVLIDSGKTLLTTAPITAPMATPTVTATFDSSVDKIVITKPSAGDVTKYEPFIDIWIAGVSTAEAEVADSTDIHTTGVSPSIRPAKNLFRHVAFRDEVSETDKTIVFKDTEGAVFGAGVKIVSYVKRYTKDGLQSVVVQTSNVTIAKV